MSKWVSRNWDKLLTGFVLVVLAGVVGHYSVILSVKSDIADLRERVTVVETQISSAIKPQLDKLGNINDQVKGIQQDIDFLKRQNEIALQISKLLELRLEEQRTKTLQELNALLKATR